MQSDRPSYTAAFVAAARGLPQLLPPEARLVEDPYGVRFSRIGKAIARAAARRPELARRALGRVRPLYSMALWLQIRTRVLDDVLLDFVAGGGRQVLLLGAGYDCRAARFRDRLGATLFYEVDHPATQARKIALLADTPGADTNVVRVAWDFEHDPMAALPDRLAALGHDRNSPTLTIWEGVTPYLTEGAIEATVKAVHALSAPGSPFALTYIPRDQVQGTRQGRLLRRLVALGGEPIRFGWDPEELPAWMEARGFRVLSNRNDHELARELLPEPLMEKLGRTWRRIAVVERIAVTARTA